MKVVFIGNVLFSYAMLKKLIFLNCNIQLVITSYNNSFNSDYYDLKPLCKKHNINYIETKNIEESKILKKLNKDKPDYIFCMGWSKILSKRILSIPIHYSIGYHPADLPNNRGRHPIIWAKVLGLNKTASCFFKINEGIDTGDIIIKNDVKILQNDDSSILYGKLIKIAEFQITKIINMLIIGKKITLKKQKKITNSWRKRNIIDGKIDWRMNAKNIDNLIKSLNKPYPGAHFIHKGKIIKVWKSKIIKNNSINIEPGKVISKNKNYITIKCGVDSIRVMNLSPTFKIEHKYLTNE